MMTELCQELRNWFDRGLPKYQGRVVISEGTMSFLDGIGVNLAEGQYFRIIGSVFNDGVHKYMPDAEVEGDALVDESFTGVVRAMAVPPSVVALADDIEQWNALYGGVDSVNMSPYNSESFGGYSYSKSGGGSAGSASGSGGTWQAAFKDRLNRWRKI